MIPLANPQDVAAGTLSMPALDLSKYHRRFEHGDITVLLTWSLHSRRPCLVLVPTYARAWSPEYITPCIVPTDRAWLWDEATGDPGHTIFNSQAFADCLGMNRHDPRTIMRITSIVQSHLGDLILCPPMPRFDQVEVAIATLTDAETGEQSQKGITEDV